MMRPIKKRNGASDAIWKERGDNHDPVHHAEEI
jgi:hypothetical protein